MISVLMITPCIKKVVGESVVKDKHDQLLPVVSSLPVS